MDDDSLSGLVTLIVLVALHAILTMAHAVLVNMRMGTIRDLANDGDPRARWIIELVASSNMIITYQLLSLLIRFAIAAITILNIADPLLADNTNLNTPATYAISLFIVASLTLILGDLVPEAVGSTYANQLVYPAAVIMRWLVILSSPVSLLILRISKLLSTLFRSNQLVNTITEEEIMSMIDAGHSGGSIEEEEKDMIYSVLQLDQTRVSEVMVPRIDVVAVDINEPLDVAAQKFISSGYSRIPVYEEHIDNVRGLLYAKDLLECWSNGEQSATSIKGLMRPAYFVPETKRADELLKEIQLQKVHMAIVVDEYGGTAGLVTIENIIEEIIGDIQDEYDLHEEAEYEEVSPDEYYVDASIDLDDFNQMLEVDLPTDDSDTLGGYIYTHFGRVPLIGEVIDGEKLTLTVQSVEGRRLRKVHVIRKRPEIDEDEAEAAEVDEEELEQAEESEASER